MYLDVFIFFLISLLQSSLRISPGQGQNNQLFGGSRVSVKSIEKVTSTQEQVQEYCNWRKEAPDATRNGSALGLGAIDAHLLSSTKLVIYN